MERPLGIEEEHLVFLDDLRESGITNMFGARPFLEERFDLSKKAAENILIYWMKTFKERRP